MEYYGYQPNPTSSDVDFSGATLKDIITTGGKTPPISYAGSVPEGATNLDGVNETTQKINVGGSDIRVNTIRNGPVRYVGFEQGLSNQGLKITDQNLVSGGGYGSFSSSNGTFGTYPQGTKVDTKEQSEPYNDLGTAFTYTNGSPADGQYNVENSKVNLAKSPPTWWNLAGHTSGNEMDKFAIVNGANPGQTILSQTVNVEPNSAYLASVWVANMMKLKGYTSKTGSSGGWFGGGTTTTKFTPFAEPKLNLEITDQNGRVLYNQQLGASLPANEKSPEWKQFGDLVRTSADTTRLTMTLVSTGEKADGNDYAIDDFSVRKVTIPSGLTTIKKPGVDTVALGDTVTYTVTFQNTYQRDITNARFSDPLPEGLTFLPGSVKLNGASQPTYDAVQGFPLPSPIRPGETITVTFNTQVTKLPNPNPAVNTAKTTYDYSYIPDNTPTNQTETTPGSPLQVANGADVLTTKTADKPLYKPGDTVTYTITVMNNGPAVAKSPVVRDAIPDKIENPAYSVLGGSSGPWPGAITLPDMPAKTSRSIRIQGTVKAGATGSLANTATTTTDTPNKSGGTNISTGKTGDDPINGDPKISETADVKTTKVADKKTYTPGETINYTIVVQNDGPAAAKTPSVSDNVPNQIENPAYTVDGVAYGPWTGSTTLPDIPAGTRKVIRITGKIKAGATGSLANSATTTTTTPNKDGGPNTTTGKTGDDPINGNPAIGDTADVKTTKTAGKKTYSPGETVTYTITIVNNGPGVAKTPKITDNVPSQLESQQYSVDGVSYGPWTGETTLPDMPAGKTTTITITGKLKTGATGSLANSATTTTPTPNKDGGPNTSTGKTGDDPINGDPVIGESADVTTAKTADKASYLPGDNITYTITVTNKGPAAAKAPKISDALPTQVENPQFSVDGGSPSAWSGETILPDMPAGKVTIIKITGRVKTGATGSLANSATTTTATPDKTGGPNTSTGTTPGNPGIGETADIVGKKSADKKNYVPGDNIVYTIMVTNNGPATAKIPKVSDPVPAQLETLQYSVDGGVPAAWSGETTLPDMAIGKTSIIKITGKVKAGATGSLANVATITTSTPNKDGGTNTVTAKTSDDPTNGDPRIGDTADVKTIKTADKKSYNPGESITYTITVTNSGPAVAKAPKVSDSVPSQIENPQFSVDSGPRAQWNGETVLPDMPAGKTTIITITGRIKTGAAGNLANSATTATSTPNKDGGPNTTTGKTGDDPINGDPHIGDTADVTTKKTADKLNYLPNDTITYTITVTNAGPAAAKTPKVTDTLPAQLENPKFSVDGGVINPWTGETTLPDLAAGASSVITITGKVKAGATGSLANSATTTTSTPGKDGGPNTSTGKTPTDPAIGDTADVKTTKSADKKNYNPGDTITYTIQVVNGGPGTAKAPKVSDNVPDQIENPQYSVDGGAASHWPGEITLPDMPSGKTTVISITGKIKSGSTGSLANSAAVTTPTPNKDGGPNTTTGKTVDDPKNGDPVIGDTADVKTTKVADKKNYNPGETIVYTITVTNAGPKTAKAPKVSDSLPPQIENPQFTVDGGAQNLWTGETTLPDMPAGKVTTIKITGKIKAGASGSLANSATTTTPTPNRDGGTNTTTGKTTDDPINGDPAIGDTANVTTKKAADKKSYNPGDTITYTITVTNGGPSAAKAPKITDAIPQQIENPQFSVDGGAMNPWTGETTLADMPAGKVSIIKITGKVKAGASGSLANSAITATSTPNKDGGPNITTGKTTDDPNNGDPSVSNTADIVTKKVADRKTYNPGDDIAYTITVANNGPATAKTPKISDNIPSQITNQQFTVDGGPITPWTGETTLPDMVMGKITTIRITGKIKQGASGSLANSATTTTLTPGKNGGPNTSTGKTSDDPNNGDPVIGDTADVKTTKAADKKSYKPGDSITYTITVINRGPSAAKAPKVADNVPSQVENPMFSVDGGALSQWSGSATLEDMPSGNVKIVKITGKIKAGATGVLANSATVTTTTPNKDGGPNTTTGKTTDDPINGDPVIGDTADVKTTKTADKKKYNPGDSITYTITVTNNGPAVAKAPKVSDNVPSQISGSQYTVDGGASAPWTGEATLGDMPAGKVTVIKITGTVKAGATGSLANSATTTTPTPNKDGGNNTTTGKTTDDPINGDPVIGDTADVKITKTADRKSYNPGEDVTYTITITNSGPSAAKAPKVSDNVPSQISNPRYSVDGGAMAPWTGEITLPDMPAGKITIIKITGAIKAGATGSLANSATVATPTPNKDGKDNTVTGKTSDDPINGNPVIGDTADVKVTKTADKKSYNPGETITYTIAVTNSGPSGAKAPIVRDAVPQQVENPMFSVNSGPPASWTGATILPDMPAGQTTLIRITGRVKAGAAGSLANSAAVSTTTPNKDGKENTVTGKTTDDPINGDPVIGDTADVKTTKTADKKVYNPGETITYTIAVSNSGPAVAKAPKVTDTVPAGVENPQFSVDGGPLAHWIGETTLPDMPAGKTTLVRITGKIKANASGSLANSATTTTPTPNKDGMNNTTTGKTSDDPINGDPSVAGAADVTTKKSADKKGYSPGETITYTITVTNAGPGTAKAPKVSDAVPAQIESPQYSVDNVALGAWSGEATLPDMPAGKVTVVKITGTIKANASGSLANSATTTTPTPNKDGGNNTTTGRTTDDPINGDPSIIGTADLVVTKVADKAALRPGEVLTYAITLTNNGPATAKAPVVNDRIIAPIENPQYSLDGGVTWSPWTGSVTLPDITQGARAIVVVRGTVNRDTPPGELTNSATVTTTTPGKDGQTTPKTSTTATTTITPVARLVMTVTVDKDNPRPGEDLTYTINLKNNGPAGAKTPTITFPPPTGLTDIRFSNDGGKTWTPWTGSTKVPDLPNGGTTSILVRGKVEGNTPNINSNITTTSTTDDPEAGKNIVSRDTAVTGTADVSATKTADKTSAIPGDTITYTISVNNAGPSAAKTPTITDALPAAIENPQFSVDDGASWRPWTGSATFTDLPPNTRKSIQIRGTISKTATGSLENTATIRTPTPWLDGTNPPIPAKSTPVNVSPPTADVGITVNVDKPTPKRGDTVTYTVDVKNKGPAPATDTEIGFVPPPNLKNVEYTTDGGNTWTPWTGKTTIPTLPNGGTKQIQIRGKADGDQPNLTTTITAKQKENDPNPSDNTVTTTTTVDQPVNIVTIVKVDKDNPQPGDNVNITVTVRNDGPGTAITPEVTFRPPRGISDIEYSKDGGRTWTPWPGNTTLNDIPNGSNQQFVIRGKVDGSEMGTITSSITAASRNNDPNSPYRTGTAQINVSEKAQVIVQFCCNNSIICCQPVSCGQPVPRPADPVRHGFTFAGWFIDGNRPCPPWNFADPIHGNITLFAKWSRA